MSDGFAWRVTDDGKRIQTFNQHASGPEDHPVLTIGDVLHMHFALTNDGKVVPVADSTMVRDTLAAAIEQPEPTDHEKHMTEMLLRKMRGLPVERNCPGQGWLPARGDSIDKNHEYRAPVKKLVIPWEHIKPEYKFAAMDEKGRIVVGLQTFNMSGSRLTYHGSSAVCYTLNIDTDGIEWRESLTERPSC